jgi:hypothetical protein
MHQAQGAVQYDGLFSFSDSDGTYQIALQPELTYR